MVYAQSRDQAEDVARELTSRYQINAAAFACDITDKAAVDALVGAVTARFGRLDILVNAASIARDGAIDALEPGDWDAVIQTNLSAATWLISAACKLWRVRFESRSFGGACRDEAGCDA